ncbi:MAG: choice-of-anchor D domain-containing protein [Casimicrobiaceae bacterium]
MGSRAIGTTCRPAGLFEPDYRRRRTALACLCTFVLAPLVMLATTLPARAADTVPMLLAPAAPTTIGGKAIPKAQRLRPEMARARAVRVDLEYLDPRSPSAAERIGVELFDGRVIVLQKEAIEQRGARDYSWHGHVVGNPESQVVLSVVNGEVAGTVELFDPASRTAESYRIESNGQGGAALVEIDHDGFPSDHPAGAESLMQMGIGAEARFSRRDDPAKASASADSSNTLDVMVVYSTQTASATGSAIGAQIQQAIDVANTIYANSGITTRLRLVYYGPANYDESGDFYTDLNRLTSTSDGYLDNVHALRNTYGADLVSLFIENGAYCGLGWVGPSASYAFTVVNRGCASGNYSFAHELGHNMGALHDPYVDSSNTPYGYGHGYVNAAGAWRTVMAYNNACAAAGTNCTRIPYFSNANLTYGGAALGTISTSDNVRVINQNAYAVANFRAAIGSAGGCSYALAPASASVGAGTGSGSIGVTTGPACAVSAASSAAWLNVASTPGGTGSTSVGYSVAANNGPARSGIVTVNGIAFTVSQASGCSYTLSSPSASAGAAGGGGSVGVSTASGCPWTVSSSASWLSATTTIGLGGASITYAVAANAGVTRTANLVIGGRTFTVTQAAVVIPAPGKAAFSTGALDFGRQRVGTASRIKSVTLSNAGAAALTLTALTPGGNDSADFARSGSCAAGQSLAPGQSCIVRYAFTPSAFGSRAANVQITTTGGTTALQLTGSGR